MGNESPMGANDASVFTRRDEVPLGSGMTSDYPRELAPALLAASDVHAAAAVLEASAADPHDEQPW